MLEGKNTFPGNNLWGSAAVHCLGVLSTDGVFFVTWQAISMFITVLIKKGLLITRVGIHLPSAIIANVGSSTKHQ